MALTVITCRTPAQVTRAVSARVHASSCTRRGLATLQQVAHRGISASRPRRPGRGPRRPGARPRPGRGLASCLAPRTVSRRWRSRPAARPRHSQAPGPSSTSALTRRARRTSPAAPHGAQHASTPRRRPTPVARRPAAMTPRPPAPPSPRRARPPQRRDCAQPKRETRGGIPRPRERNSSPPTPPTPNAHVTPARTADHSPITTCRPGAARSRPDVHGLRQPQSQQHRPAYPPEGRHRILFSGACGPLPPRCRPASPKIPTITGRGGTDARRSVQPVA